MTTWFVSYAHTQGFGRVVLTMDEPHTDEDFAHVENAIAQNMGYQTPPVILYYRPVGTS